MSIISSIVMIKYRLICETEHEFDGWFPNSSEFTRQKKNGQLVCPVCESKVVNKTLMAPNIGKSIKDQKIKKMREGTLSPQQFIPASQAKNVLKRIGRYIVKNFENVGDRFYDEVKKCKDGGRDDKFYGTPSQEETNKLLEQGIDLFHVPKIKDN